MILSFSGLPICLGSVKSPYRPQFDDNSEQTIDFQPLLAGEMYGPLGDLTLFNKVSLDPEVETLVWPNGADFDPATLNDWPIHERAFIELARCSAKAG